MPNTLANSLAACVRGLDTMILPAIDPANPLALEQAGLISKTLRFAIERIPHLIARSRQEMRFYRQMAEAMAPHLCAIAGADPAGLARLCARADRLWRDPHASLDDLDAAQQALSDRIAAIARLCRTEDSHAAREVERIVLREGVGINQLNRAWQLPLGFEVRPEEIPPLASFFPATEPAGDRA